MSGGGGGGGGVCVCLCVPGGRRLCRAFRHVKERREKFGKRKRTLESN